MHRLLAILLALAPVGLYAQNAVTLPAGSATLKSLHFQGYPGLGLYESSAGVLYLGDSVGGFTCTYGSGCGITGTFTAARSFLTEDALQVYPIGEIRNATYAAPITATEAAGTFNWTLGTNTIVLSGEVTDNETETSVAYFQFIIPHEYVSAGDVTVRFRAELLKSGDPVDDGSTLDLSCYEQADGAVGSDLVATAAATFAALDTFYNKDFALTATGLVAGDIINCKITTAVVDSEAGAGSITFTSDPPKVLLDVKG